jgi:hypothetical protein
VRDVLERGMGKSKDEKIVKRDGKFCFLLDKPCKYIIINNVI